MAARTLLIAQETFSVDTLVRRVGVVMVGVDLAVFLRYAVTDWPRPWLHILGEPRTVAWLSSMQLALAGWLAIAISLVMAVHGSARYHRWQRVGWTGCGLAFLLLAADESLRWRETLQGPLHLPAMPLGVALLSVLAVTSGLVAFLMMLPQLLAVPRSLWLFVGATVLGVLSQVDDALGWSQRVVLSLPWQHAVGMSTVWLKLMAEVGFIMAMVALLATYVSRMASSGTSSAAIARSRLSAR
jgi:hypothetical protein